MSISFSAVNNYSLASLVNTSQSDGVQLAARPLRTKPKPKTPPGNFGRPHVVPHGGGQRPKLKVPPRSNFFTHSVALPKADSSHWKLIRNTLAVGNYTVPIAGAQGVKVNVPVRLEFSPPSIGNNAGQAQSERFARIVKEQNPRDWPEQIEVARNANGSQNQRLSLLATTKKMNTIIISGVHPSTGKRFESTIAFYDRTGRQVDRPGNAEKRLYIGLNTNLDGGPTVGDALYQAVARYAKAHGYTHIETIRDTRSVDIFERRTFGNQVRIVDNQPGPNGEPSPMQRMNDEDRNSGLPRSKWRVRLQDEVAPGAVRNIIPMTNPNVQKLLGN
jgi:hypothetical protein